MVLHLTPKLPCSPHSGQGERLSKHCDDMKINPAELTKRENAKPSRFAATAEYNGVQLTLIGDWIDLAAYYKGSDGNVWSYQPLSGYGGNWSNQGDYNSFVATMPRRRGRLFPVQTTIESEAL